MRDLAEVELAKAGFDLNKIPDSYHSEHMWADGLLLFWHRHKRLPTAEELAYDMMDEWDSPVSLDEAQEILDFLSGVPDEKKNG